MSENRNIWLFGHKLPILKNKNLLIETYIKRMLNRTLRMFEYKNLPETLPQREIELIIQTCRVAIFTKVDDKLFVFYGGLGGEPNEYYQPTQAIVSNPYLRFSEVLKLDDYIKNDGNAVIVWNDSTHMGLYPILTLNAELLAECDLSIKYALVNKRFMNVLTADDDNTKDSLREMFESVEDGTGYGIVVTKQFMEDSSIDKVDTGIRQNTDLKDIMEMKQYILGSWYNDMGLNALFNMKRESINETESDLNEDALLPFVDDMLEQRKIGVAKINEMFGTNIEVDLSSSWKKIRKEIEQREELQDAMIEETLNEVSNDEPEEQPEEEPPSEEKDS